MDGGAVPLRAALWRGPSAYPYETSRHLKDRVFRSALDGSPSRGPASWFALPTDDPQALAAHLADAPAADICDHLVRGDFETWLRDLYRRPDLAEGVRRIRERWTGNYVPRNELIAVLRSPK